MTTPQPLPSWLDGPSKRAILDYVDAVTRPESKDFIPEPERIAVFDNDGTLWPENPFPVQGAFVMERLRARVTAEPALRKHVMVQAAFRKDLPTLLANHHHGLIEIFTLTHAGLTTAAFTELVEEWIRTARHPRFDRPYDQCIYLPMRELLSFLRSRGFKTFIVSGGGQDFMRPWTERVYGIPPEQVVGSRGRVRYGLVDELPVLVKTMESLYVDDKEGKPPAIHEFIGRKPVFAFGNSDGDKEMLEYVTLDNPHRSLGLILHHTDAEREYAYEVNPESTGTLVEAKADAPKRGWHLVDMKEEWATVFADDRVTAVDILLEPDAVMLERAAEMNRSLLGLHPQGFPLDSAHRPHVTLLQRFVGTDQLDEVHRAVEAVLARVDLAAMRLEATGLYYIPDGDTGVAGIVIRPTPELTRLQEELIDATAPFTAPTGPSSAFVTSPDDLVINPALIRYVERFTEDSAGEHFNPHVTVGVGPWDELDRMVARPFSTFSFGVSGAAVYQLGQFGTAARRLHELTAV